MANRDAEEAGSSDADNAEGGIAKFDGVVENVGRTCEGGLPKVVADDGNGMRALGGVIGSREEAAKRGLSAEGGEESARDNIRRERLHLVATVERAVRGPGKAE